MQILINFSALETVVILEERPDSLENSLHRHIHQGLDQFDPFGLQIYKCSRQRFFGLSIVPFPYGL